MSNPEVDIKELQNRARALLDVYRAKDITPLFELDKLLVSKPDLRQKFIADPRRVAKETVGYDCPEGHDLHFVDPDNVYYPAEGSALQQLLKEPTNRKWIRVELRAASGRGGCVAWCGVCPT